MKIVFSRKGFDAGTGGCPSPIGPDGQMVSLPIPGASRQRYRDLDSPLGNVGNLVEELSKGKMKGRMPAHHDPDLWAGSRLRGEGWRPSLGQCGIAQSHLAGQCVGPGDVLLFFGWFRPVEQREGGWSYVKGSPDQHVMFGYLQIGRSLVLGPAPKVSDLAQADAWLADHPHLMGTREANNTLHMASDELVIDGRPTGLPGGGAFSKFSPGLVLSAPDQPSKSLWRLPAWMAPRPGRGLSYHATPERWTQPEGPGSVFLQTVAKGQEFVLDASGDIQAGDWLRQVIGAGCNLDLGAKPPSMQLRRLKL